MNKCIKFQLSRDLIKSSAELSDYESVEYTLEISNTTHTTHRRLQRALNPRERPFSAGNVKSAPSHSYRERKRHVAPNLHRSKRHLSSAAEMIHISFLFLSLQKSGNRYADRSISRPISGLFRDSLCSGGKSVVTLCLRSVINI
ncbi:hypothetical protein CDAR_9741 [Caerostris darwini]|uniref:Uncharacterized protein n=1 Tax=Caerostris darwini TaxID=1538125 RepID=A0AAV4UR54_9ARAC|nr:hypothetical protein CDAR_9741 [Caerostris darwini]